MTLDGIMTDAKEFEVGFRLYFAPLITNGACLGSSARGGVLRVEIEDDSVADEV
jgi:hypothetical protein